MVPASAPEASGDEITGSTTVFSGSLLRVRVEQVLTPANAGAPRRTVRRETVAHPGAVAVVAVTRAGELVLVRQYRHAARRHLLEIPAGTREPGERPEETALRELREETGYKAESLHPLGSFFTAPGYCTEEIFLFRAEGLTAGTPDPDPGEDIEVVLLALPEARRRLRDGEFRDAKTLAGLAALFLGKEEAA